MATCLVVANPVAHILLSYPILPLPLCIYFCSTFFASRLSVTTPLPDLIAMLAGTQLFILVAYMQIILLDLYQNSLFGVQLMPFLVIANSGLGGTASSWLFKL